MSLSQFPSWASNAGKFVLFLGSVVVLALMLAVTFVLSVPLVAMNGALFLTAMRELMSGKILSAMFWIFVQMVFVALAHAMGLRSPLPGILDYLHQDSDTAFRRAEASDYVKHGMAPERAAEIVGEREAQRLPDIGVGRMFFNSLVNYLVISLFSVAVLFAVNWYSIGSLLPPG